jgi:hypothetical protein
VSRAFTDLAALVVFALVGLVSHRGGVSAHGLARDALPLVGAWAVVSAALRTYPGGGIRRLLATWIVAVPLAVLVRALVLGRHLGSSEAAFLGVSLAFTLVFLLAGRAALTLAARRRRASAASRPGAPASP